MKTKRWGLGLGLATVLVASAAYAAGVYTPGMPAAPLPILGTYQFGVDTEFAGGAQPQSAYMSLSTLAGYVTSVGSTSGQRNMLIGGDFTTNLWQRGNNFTSIANSVTYTADRFAVLGGASSLINVSKQTGASDISQAYGASYRFQRQAASTDTTAICFGQVVETNNSIRAQGQLVEFDFHALAGANFSATSSLINATIATGTGSDEGAAGFFGASWTGYAATTTAVTVDTSWNRYGVVATIPAAATEIGVKICFTPVGTAGANDWVEFEGMQLAVNAAADAITAPTGAGAAGLLSSFERRAQGLETLLQQRYFWKLTETANPIRRAMGQAYTTGTAHFVLKLPTTMRTTPTVTTAAGFATTNVSGTAANCSALSATASAGSVDTIDINCLGSGMVAGNATQLLDNSGTGTISVSAEE